MQPFLNDVDILKREPILFGELHFPSQVKAAGTGAILSGTHLTASCADFSNVNVASGGVIYLKTQDGSLDGVYEIVSVDAPEELTVSVVRADSADAPVAPPAANDIAWRISTFEQQAEDVASQLAEYFGIRPGDPAAVYSVEDVMDLEVLRRASTLAVISHVYTSWATETGDGTFWTKSVHYKQEFEKARLRCHLSIDANHDGVAELTRTSGSIKLVRD